METCCPLGPVGGRHLFFSFALAQLFLHPVSPPAAASHVEVTFHRSSCVLGGCQHDTHFQYVCRFRKKKRSLESVVAKHVAALCFGGESVGESLRADPWAPDSSGWPGRGRKNLPGQAGRGADRAVRAEGERQKYEFEVSREPQCVTVRGESKLWICIYVWQGNIMITLLGGKWLVSMRFLYSRDRAGTLNFEVHGLRKVYIHKCVLCKITLFYGGF